MALIEGFGDEVIFFLIAILTGIVVIIAWMSTHVDASPFIHIIILDRDRFSELLQRLRRVAARLPAIIESQTGAATRVEQSTSVVETPEVAASVPHTGNTATGHTAGNTATGQMVDLTETSSETTTAKKKCGKILTNHSAAAGLDIDDMMAEGTENRNDNYSVLCEGAEPDLVNEGRKHGMDQNHVESSASLFSKCSSPCSNSKTVSSHEDISAVDGRAFVESVESAATFTPEVQSVPAGLGAVPAGPAINVSVEEVTIPDGHVQIRLQYIDGRQRTVYANPDDTIAEFKR